ncbi:glycosyltransferase family 52 [Photobacterium leiognathi]|uniref:glycosyltransferase family 52 n=1 Tax=Photobacterium leiognathi TaxID=553611 RepID=UPI000D17C0AF|nr:glycosyltransferase family 52 [Photobacterium leiognathi]PSW42962.1 hypothetical protein C0W40_14155 [Photobacterium leiognathi subsp. mandapamensis]
MNLIIATTRFQAFYISEILKKENVNDFIFLYKSNISSDINCPIVKGLKDRSSKFIFYENKKFPFDIFDAIMHFSNKNVFENVYVASINSRYIHKVLSIIKYRNLYTYDDGSANIIHSSFFFDKTTLIEKIFNCFFSIRKNKEILKLETKKHYTLYEDMSNITSRLYYFNPFCFNSIANKCLKDKAVIFIGPVFDEMFNDYQSVIDNVNNYISNVEADFFYIKHPRNTIKSCFDEYIISDDSGLAELIIKKKASEYSNVELLGFFSSAQLNTIGISNVNSAVFNDVFKSKFDYSELLDKFNNIKIIS